MRLLTCLILLALTSCATRPSEERAGQLRGSFGTYDAEPRLANGHVDANLLLSELVELDARTYNWLIWHGDTDWDDLKTFLPLAKQHHISVWVTLVPPSESPPKTGKFSEPFRLDYEKWAAQIAALSKDQPNLVAWSIDDFCANRKLFTPVEVRKMMDIAHAKNPRLAFVPCCYYSDITPVFATNFGSLLDGVLFPYRDESNGINMDDASHVVAEIQKIKSVMGRSMPVILDVYATPHSQYLNGSQPPYVRAVMG